MGRADRERHSVATRISWGAVAAYLAAPVTAPVAALLDISGSSNQLRKDGHPYALR
jgi:hypothetical protein